MDIRLWNMKLKQCKDDILYENTFDMAIKLCLELHAAVHSKEISNFNYTYEDELWDDLDDVTFRKNTNKKGRTIAYGLWHSTRIEDITMNLLVARVNQIFNKDWQTKINSSIIDTGNSLTNEEILEFSSDVNRNELKNYRDAVGKRTIEIMKHLKFSDMKKKIQLEDLQRVYDEGAVLEMNKWLVDYWGRKNVAGILFMPATRHHVVHISESMEAKRKKVF